MGARTVDRRLLAVHVAQVHANARQVQRLDLGLDGIQPRGRPRVARGVARVCAVWCGGMWMDGWACMDKDM